MRQKLIVAAVGLLCLTQHSLAAPMFEEVENLTDDNFFDTVLSDTDNYWAVTFYNDRCAPCFKFSSEFLEASLTEFSGSENVKFGGISVLKNREVPKDYGVKYAPTVLIFGEDKSEPVWYNGPRLADDLVDFLEDYCIESMGLEPESGAIKVIERDEKSAALVEYVEEKTANALG